MKPINRTDSMKNVREIPNSGGKVVLYEDGPGGQRKIRCPKCSGLATPSRSPGGKNVATCGSCQASFTSTAM
jgi:hypothetical protein